MNRRNFIKNSLFGAIGLGLSSSFYSWQIEPFWLEFVHKKMKIPFLPENLKGRILMQISDLHIGNRFDYQYIIDSFIKAQKLKPDFVVYTGDIIHYETKQQFDQLEEVLPYFVKGKLGTVGVLGNHDYGKKWQDYEVADKVSELLGIEGITILRNEIRTFSSLNFIGIDDYWSVNFDGQKAMNFYKQGLPTVVLCHNPDVCDLPIWNNYKGWILSGHTHGGQVKAPFLPPFILPVKNRKYSQGEIELNDGRTLYVNRAIGHSYQVRFNVRPEITVFELDQI